MKNLKKLLVLVSMLSIGFTAAAKTYLNSDHVGVHLESIYDNEMSKNISLNKKFQGENPDIMDYAFVITKEASILDKPGTSANLVKKIPYGTKVRIFEKIYANGNPWYRVQYGDSNDFYIYAKTLKKRVFRFDQALNAINNLEQFIESESKAGRELAVINSYVPNPNNSNLSAAKDKYGMSIDQNVPGTNGKETIYVADRSVISILKKGEKTSQIKVASIPEPVTIPTNKISRQSKLSDGFNKVVAIDTENQNFIVLEKNRGTWEVISYVYSKTGIESQIGFETPKGFFMAAVAKYVMPYNDEGGEKQGYAKYAIRFSGGGYLHGTPINHVEETNKEFFIRQKELSLGTFTGTRKCVRTTEEHAKFLFDWVVAKANPSQNEQHISSNVAFLVF